MKAVTKMIKSRKVHDWKVRCHQWPCCCCKNIWIKVPISQWKYPKRVFCHVQSKARESQKKKRPIASNLRGHQPRGHLPLLGSLDQMIEKFLLALWTRGGLITLVIAVCVVKKKRMKTTGKIEIPNGAEKEAQLLYWAKREAQLLHLHNIVSLVDDHNIPDSLILNFDQTKLKYIPSARHTLVENGLKSITIAGPDDKWCMTGTFTVSLKGFFTNATHIWWEDKSKSSAL